MISLFDFLIFCFCTFHWTQLRYLSFNMYISNAKIQMISISQTFLIFQLHLIADKYARLY